MRRSIASSVPRRGLSDERSLLCDDASRLDDEVTDWVGHDRLRRAAYLDGYEVGPRAGLEAIRLQAERSRSAIGGRLQRQLDLLIAPEGAAVGNLHGPFQHVAAPERAPQVADAVVAAGDGDSGGAQSGDGRDRKLYTAAVTRLTPASASCRPSRSWVAWSACARPYAWLTATRPPSPVALALDR